MAVAGIADTGTAARLRADLVAGLTVAIVALPLAMALGIASGASPDNKINYRLATSSTNQEGVIRLNKYDRYNITGASQAQVKKALAGAKVPAVA